MTIIIEKATIKMKKLLKYILLLIYVALMPACGEDSGLDGVFANKPFALVTAADGGRTSISAVIDDGKRTIRLTFDKKRDVDAVELTFQLNPGYAMVSPKEPETTMDLTQPRTVTGQLGSRGGLLRNLSPERNPGLVGLFPVSRETDRGSD